MPLNRSRRLKRLARTSALAALATLAAPADDLSAQARGFANGGGGTSTSRVASPTVVASWVAHQEYSDGNATTLLVLWRGTPGWFSKGSGGRSGGGGSGRGGGSGAGRSGSYAYEYLSQGGLTFMMEFDYEKRMVKILNQEISLKDSNVVLVDFVDSPSGPTIVGSRWVDPAPDPAPPDQPSVADPIAAVIKRTPELFEYLHCDLSLSDPVMKAMMPLICGQMRP
jgi:hypothetical protein